MESFSDFCVKGCKKKIKAEVSEYIKFWSLRKIQSLTNTNVKTLKLDDSKFWKEQNLPKIISFFHNTYRKERKKYSRKASINASSWVHLSTSANIFRSFRFQLSWNLGFFQFQMLEFPNFPSVESWNFLGFFIWSKIIVVARL